MKKFMRTKYFVAILAVIALAYNLILFLSVKKTTLKLNVFWFNYAFVMVAFIGILLLGFLGKTNNRQVDLFIPVASPVLYFAILLGTIFFFFVSKISLLAVVIPFVLIYAVAIISLILACFYQDHLKNVPHKEVEIIDFNGLKEYLMMLQTKTTNEIANKKINNILDKLASLNADGEEALAANAKRIFEYAQFMKKDLENNEINNFLMNASSLEKLLDGVNK